MFEYFLYARKSTDVEDKQVRSIEDQLAVLRALAKQEGLDIVHEFTEKRTAKKPGRPVFNEMMERIERGEAQGILCWKLDRLSRNPFDDGRIRWLHQSGTIQHVRTYERDYQSSDNTLLMSLEFSMANQYIRDLSTNVKRRLDEKVKNGEYPSLAPIGYLNDRLKKTIIVDPKKAKIVKAAFELYAKNNSRLEDMGNFFAEHGIVSEGGKKLARNRIDYILSNPFYCGIFRYNGELHEGKHPPIISKKLFDDVQDVMKDRGRPHSSLKNNPKPLCGLIRCGECNCMITAETRVKRQKNGNIHSYLYYRCTKRRGHCSQTYVRGEELDKQLSTTLKSFAMPPEWAQKLLAMADKDEKEAIRSSTAASQTIRAEIVAISEKLRILLDAFLEQDIDRDTYRAEKAGLVLKKKSLEEKIADLNKGYIVWLEPLRNWIKDAQTLNEINDTTPLPLKKSFAQKIFGSNLFLKNQKIVFTPITPSAALCAALRNFTKKPNCFIVERDTRIELASHAWEACILPLY